MEVYNSQSEIKEFAREIYLNTTTMSYFPGTIYDIVNSARHDYIASQSTTRGMDGNWNTIICDPTK